MTALPAARAPRPQLPFLSFLTLLAVAISAAFADEDGNDSSRLTDWILEKGGTIDARQVIRTDRFKARSARSPPRGVYAAEEIEEGALLCSIPWEIIVKPSEDASSELGQCSLARALSKELRLGGESELGPYIELMKALGTPKVPETWSEAGRDLLGQVLGSNLPPQNFVRFGLWWQDNCGGDLTNSTDFDAVMLMVTRAASVGSMEEGVPSQAVMVPFYDLYNHRNGRYHNTRVEAVIGEDFKVLASRKIRKGEQIYNSYGNSTSEMLSDYGFIEQLPQRWRFDFGNGKETEFILDAGDDGSLTPNWTIRPDGATIEAMDKELKRLMKVEMDVWDISRKKAKEGGLPKEELDTVWKYHGALMNAIDHSIIYARGGGSVRMEL